jgi:ribosome-associated protein
VTASDQSISLALTVAEAAADKLASDIVIIDVSERLVITDCFVLASAPNDRQIRAIVDEVEQRAHGEGVRAIRREGERDGRWVLLDLVDVVVHVQHSEEREYYALERLWKDCPQIPLPESVASRAAAGRP